MWLEECLQLPYTDAFREQEIDGRKLIELTEEQLGTLGVTESSHLLRLLSHIAVFRSQLGRTLLVSEEPSGYSPSQPVVDRGPWRWRPLQAEAVSRAEREQSNSGSPDRRKGTAQKSVGRAGATSSTQPAQSVRQTTPRREGAARAKSPPSLHPVLQTFTGPPASGQRVEKAPRQQTPRVRPGRSVAQGPPQGQRRTHSAEGHSQHQASSSSSSAITPRSYRDARPPIFSPPATSSMWSPDPASLSMPTFAGEASAAETGHDDYLEGTTEFSRSTPASGTRSAPMLHSARSSRCNQQGSPESIRSLKQDLSTSSKRCAVISSEFGKDHSRGASFGSTGGTRKELVPTLKPLQGPEYYEKSGRFYRGALTNKGVSQFARGTRQVGDCMITGGLDGPGVGRYEPPKSFTIRGGSWGTSARWRRSTDATKREKSPGPYSYSPQHHYISNFK